MAAADAGRPFRVALTFDAEHPDRPTDPAAESRLLDSLEAADVPATFFVQGRWAEAFPERARRLADGRHLVGSHGHYHVRMTLLSAAGLRADIAQAERAIREATERDPKPWFRCPFGTGMRDGRVLSALARAGYRHVGWDVDVEDWRPGRDPTGLAAALLEAVLARRTAGRSASIALLHTWPAPTGAGVQMVAARLRDAGAELVRVDELLAGSAALSA